MPTELVKLIWAIDWNDTGEIIPASEGVYARSENFVVGPSLGSIQTPQVARGSISVDDWEYLIDPIANPTNESLTKPHRIYLYSKVIGVTTLRWQGFCVIGKRVDRYTARLDLYGRDYIRLSEEVVIPPLNVSFPEIDPTDNLEPVGRRPTTGERVTGITHTIETNVGNYSALISVNVAEATTATRVYCTYRAANGLILRVPTLEVTANVATFRIEVITPGVKYFVTASTVSTYTGGDMRIINFTVPIEIDRDPSETTTVLGSQQQQLELSNISTSRTVSSVSAQQISGGGGRVIVGYRTESRPIYIYSRPQGRASSELEAQNAASEESAFLIARGEEVTGVGIVQIIGDFWLWIVYARSFVGYTPIQVPIYATVEPTFSGAGIRLVTSTSFIVSNKLNLAEDATQGADITFISGNLKNNEVSRVEKVTSNRGRVEYITATSLSGDNRTYQQLAASETSIMPWSAVLCPGGEACLADYTIATYTNLTTTGFRLLVKRTVNRTHSYTIKQGARVLRSGNFVGTYQDVSGLTPGTDYTIEVTVWDNVTSALRAVHESAVWAFPVRTLGTNELSSVVHIEGFNLGSSAIAVMLIRAYDLTETNENRTIPSILWRRVGGSQTEFSLLDTYPIDTVLGGHALAVVSGLPSDQGDYILEATSRPGEEPTIEGYRI